MASSSQQPIPAAPKFAPLVATPPAVLEASTAPLPPAAFKSYKDAQAAAVAARSKGDPKLAAQLFDEALRLLRASDEHAPTMLEVLGLALNIGRAECQALCDDWWAVACTVELKSVPGMPLQALLMAHNLYAQALMRLGLVDYTRCVQTLKEATRLAAKASADSQSASDRLREEHARRCAALTDGSGLDAEVAVLLRALGPGAESKLLNVSAEMATPAGRARMRDTGILLDSELRQLDEVPSRLFQTALADACVGADVGARSVVALVGARVQHRLLTYHVKKRYEEMRSVESTLDSAGEDGDGEAHNGLPRGLSGGAYRCLAPSKVLTPAAAARPPLLSAAHLATLQTNRYVVVDDVLPADAICRAANEVRELHMGGMLQTDPHDVCNPDAAAFAMPLWRRKFVATLEAECPGLCTVKEAVYSLASLLEEQLHLPLRVPQTMMLSAYPPGALYRRHYDSYGGKDIPRLVTILLYLSYEPAQAGHLRLHDVPPSAPASVDIAPIPGRMVVFFAQEVAHEVLPSEGERFAVTLWLWDLKKDQSGR